MPVVAISVGDLESSIWAKKTGLKPVKGVSMGDNTGQNGVANYSGSFSTQRSL